MRDALRPLWTRSGSSGTFADIGPQGLATPTDMFPDACPELRASVTPPRSSPISPMFGHNIDLVPLSPFAREDAEVVVHLEDSKAEFEATVARNKVSTMSDGSTTEPDQERSERSFPSEIAKSTRRGQLATCHLYLAVRETTKKIHPICYTAQSLSMCERGWTITGR